MVEDFANGLRIVPLVDERGILSSIGAYPQHPWKHLFQARALPAPTRCPRIPSTLVAPAKYANDSDLHGPAGAAAYYGGRPVMPQEAVRLSDVQSFRNKTALKVVASCDGEKLTSLTARLSTLTTASARPVIYRYIDVIRDSMAVLEAIHFELFMPDRPDLRFIIIPLTSLPPQTVEREWFNVHDADLLMEPSFSIELGETVYPDLLMEPSFSIEFRDTVYPVLWEAKDFEKMCFENEEAELKERSGMAYIVKKKAPVRGGEHAVSDISNWDFVIRDHLFPDVDCRREHALVHVTMRNMLTSHLYPVEPPLPPPVPPPITDNDMSADESSSSISEDESENGKKQKEEEKFDGRSEYLKMVCEVRTYAQRLSRVVTRVRALSASDAERIEDRLGGFTTYGAHGDLQLMDQLFRLGSRFRVSASRGADTKDVGELRVDESVILNTITDNKIGDIRECRTLIDCIYGRRGAYDSLPDAHIDLQTTSYNDGSVMRLNAAQSRAVRLYADAAGPRVFCIRSPPGSGKTTVAAAMAAEVARTIARTRRMRRFGPNRNPRIEEYDHYDSIQLLLSVQNVAVDNMGAALKKMDYGGGMVYNMKSTKKLNPLEPAPFDFFDLMNEAELEKWKKQQMILPPEVIARNKQKEKKREEEDKKNGKKGKNNKKDKKDKRRKKEKAVEECITHYRREYEKKVYPKILLSTVEMVLQKMYTESKLLNDLKKVRRVIIDEASLLTESALFCIIRRFPEARIILIGDDKQLPPFMYDEKILGHEMAGRPALSVAMKTGKVPVVELNEVYRAPPTLVAPYNRLAYNNKLVSMKAEGDYPLSEIGMIHCGLPQLMLIDVEGREMRNEKTMSLYNEKELKVLVSLLKKFPSRWTKDIMIICLYKDQKKRLQEILDKEYQANPIPEKQYTVLTVDSAQGKEKPIVILMTTRTQRATDFFCSIERCNVAVSRQQKALIILGKAPLLTTNKPWSTVVNGDDFTNIEADYFK